MSGPFSPHLGDMKAINNALHGWRKVGGFGPVYFAPPPVVASLFSCLTAGTPLSSQDKLELARGRARVVNFFNLIDSQALDLKQPDLFRTDVDALLKQLAGEVATWRKSFKSLDVSPEEAEIFFRVVATSAPVLFNMGFFDAIPHSAQVSRLTASMAYDQGARASEVLMSYIVGWLHDPKLHPKQDLEKENLATHPVNASALAFDLTEQPDLRAALLRRFRGNEGKLHAFTTGLVDALGINNDSRFVNMMVILPAFAKRFGVIYGLEVASELKSVFEGRLESASKKLTPPVLPDHLHGALSQMRLDSGLRGVSGTGFRRAMAAAGLGTELDPQALLDSICDGEAGALTAAQLDTLKGSLAATANAILRADINATSMLHHHQEVKLSGRVAAAALVVADPMMLAAHKILPVYKSAVIERLTSYVNSFDDNIRLLPAAARSQGTRWQRAVYLSIVRAADMLTGGKLVDTFKQSSLTTSVCSDVDALRAIILAPASWGAFAQAADKDEKNPEVVRVIDTLKSTYEALVTEYREVVYRCSDVKQLDKFFPAA